MAGLGLTALMAIGVFAITFQLAPAPPPQSFALQAGANVEVDTPDIVGRVVGIWGNTLAIDTPAGRRTLQLHSETVVRRPDGQQGRAADLRPGLYAAVFGAPLDLQTFRVDLVVLRRPEAR
jgi:hypothetical protein